MRVVWKDTGGKRNKPYKYRGHEIYWCGTGWGIGVPGDDNIYRTHYDAENAIDKAIGDGRKPGAQRSAYGIEIVGKR